MPQRPQKRHLPLPLKALLLLAALSIAPSAWAKGLLCTMPNGMTIHNAAGVCPSDAVRSRPDDGTVFLPNGDNAAPRRQPKRAPTPAQEARQLCDILKSSGATACTLTVNRGFIAATMATSPTEAQKICTSMSRIVQMIESPLAGIGWQLHIFSPLNPSASPIASCKL